MSVTAATLCALILVESGDVEEVVSWRGDVIFGKEVVGVVKGDVRVVGEAAVVGSVSLLETNRLAITSSYGMGYAVTVRCRAIL